MDIGELRRVRSVFFPAIALQITTGFNIYRGDDNFSIEDNQVAISYMHEDLVEGKIHFEQVRKMVRDYCDQARIERISHKVINRVSSYGLDKGWRAKKYFLANQQQIEEKEVDVRLVNNETVIGYGKQNELIIRTEPKDLEKILEQFRLYSNKYEIDIETGKFTVNPLTKRRIYNPRETWDNAWEIPPIIVTGLKDKKLKAYEKVRKVSFELSNEVLSLIIGDKWNNSYEDSNAELVVPSLEYYLAKMNFSPSSIDLDFITNRIFYDWLNTIDWKKVDKTYRDFKRLYRQL